MRFNVKGTKLLSMYLHISLQFGAYKNISLKKASHAEERVRRLESTDGLELFIRQVQVAVSKAVAL